MKSNSVQSTIWFFYYCIGGVYIHDNSSRPIYKMLHFSVLSFSLLFTVCGTLGYFMTVKSAPVEDRTYALQTTSGAMFMIIVIPLTTYKYRKELNMIFEYLDISRLDRLDISKLNYNLKHCSNFNEYFLHNYTLNPTSLRPLAGRFFCMHILLPFLYFIIPLVDTLFFCKNEFSFRNSRHHIFATPFMDRMPSKTIYVVLYFMEGIINYMISELIHFQSCLVLILCIELKHIVYTYGLYMRCFTQRFNSEFERKSYLKLISRSEHRELDFTRLNDWFNDHLKIMIAKHQQFISVIRPFQSYVAMYGSMVLIICSLTQISAVFLFLRSNSETMINVRYLLLVLLVSLTFFTFCEVGTLFEEMDEAWISHVYSLPWYYLPIKIQKSVLIWQTQLTPESPLKGLLMGTLMTHKQISCIDQPVSIRCPSTTYVIIEVARYVSFIPTKESNICDIPNIEHNSIDEYQLKKCQWHKSLQYSLLQTAVENCGSKQQCHFQVKPSKSGMNPCPEIPAYIEVKYLCRPYIFNSTVGCERETVDVRCEPNTRLAIFSASYGRTQYQSVRCPQVQGVAEETCLLSYATEIVMEHCHGKRNCTLTVDSKTFSNPCKEKSRVYLRIVYDCVPRGVLSEKYDEGPDSDEYSLQEEIDQHDVLDNPESLAPYPDITNSQRKNGDSNSSAIILQHKPSTSVHNLTFSEGKEKLYIYLIGSVSGILVSSLIFVIMRLVWKKRTTRSDDKFKETGASNTSLPPSFNDEISEVDADITLAEMPAVTVISSHHHISSPSEVVRYGKDGITPRSLYHDDNIQFYYG